MALFMPNRGLGAVAGKQAGLIRQGVHLGADAAYQRIPIAAGQIRAADGVLEDQIPAKAGSGLRTMENAMPGRMPGGMTHLKVRTAKVQNHPACESERGRRAGGQAETEMSVRLPGRPRASGQPDAGR